MIAYGIELMQVYRETHALGDIVRMSEPAAVLATYFRNNILHLFALPSLIACVFLSNAQVSTGDLQRLAGRIYPYIAQELFLRWEEAELARVIEAMLAVLAARHRRGRSPPRRLVTRGPASAAARGCRSWRER
jgi:glycerol-3-phosphate O-acyltransferase